MAELLYKDESYIIRGASFAVYKKFRNNHKELVYKKAMIKVLEDQGLSVDEEHRIPIIFEDRKVGTYIPDIIVEDKIIVELKVKPFIHRDDLLQLWHYLKSSHFKLGYLINFGAKDGVQFIRRVYDLARKI